MDEQISLFKLSIVYGVESLVAFIDSSIWGASGHFTWGNVEACTSGAISPGNRVKPAVAFFQPTVFFRQTLRVARGSHCGSAVVSAGAGASQAGASDGLGASRARL